MYAIQTNHVTKKVGTDITLDGVSIAVPRGSVYGLLGPNGAGKTTLMKILCGLSRASSGTVTFSTAVKPRFGVLIETPALYDHLSAYDNLSVFSDLYGTPKQRIREVLSLVSLSNIGQKKVGQFSLGMKQRLGIAVALLPEPDILILDEPTNGLDPEGVAGMRTFLRTLPEMTGCTLVLSSHMLHEIDQIAIKIGILKAGKLIYEDSLQQLHQAYPEANTLEEIFVALTRQTS